MMIINNFRTGGQWYLSSTSWIHFSLFL